MDLKSTSTENIVTDISEANKHVIKSIVTIEFPGKADNSSSPSLSLNLNDSPLKNSNNTF